MPTDAMIKDRLNRCMPAAAEASLGDVIYDLINQHNALVAAVAAGDTGAALAGFTVALPAERAS